MTTTRKLLAGEVETDLHWDHVAALKRENDILKAEVEELRRRIAQDRDVVAGLAQFRTLMQPMHDALRRIFAEMPDVDAAAPAHDERVARLWQKQKQIVGEACASVIDALMDRPGMNTTELAMATRKSRRTIPRLIFKLNQAGLISKVGQGRFRLKDL